SSGGGSVNSERGYVGMRVLIGLGFLVALVWIVPLVFMNRQQAERAAELGGATSAPTGVTAGAPVELAEPTGSGAAPTGPIGQANDLQAQSMLNNAIRVAQVYHAETGSFQGLTPEVAAGYDPSIVYTQGVAVPNMVAMVVTPSTVVLLTVVDGGGGYLCVAANADIITFGRVNATTPEQCQGGWQ
ncbi:MAG: hypothetical protein WD670_01020, partial [Actinomycetota bacterium]